MSDTGYPFSASYKNSAFYSDALHLQEKVKSEVNDSDEENIYYTQQFAVIIVRKYVPYAPLWTNIIGTFVDKSRTHI